jgi:hypothetical protein
MAKFSEIVISVLDILKERADDAYYTEEHIIFLASNMRALLIDRKYKNSRNQTYSVMSDENEQQICVDLIPSYGDLLLCDGAWLHSVQEIPGTIGGAEPKVSLLNDLIHSMVTYIPAERMPYVGYNKWFVALDWCFKVEDFLCDASVSYNHAWGKVFKGSYNESVLRPARLTGDVALEYNWRRRVFVGADCSFATARKGEWSRSGANQEEILGYTMTMPGYADLGVYAEYVTSGMLSYWLRAGNLLNMTIQRNPLYAEKGVYFTVGISLSL